MVVVEDQACCGQLVDGWRWDLWRAVEGAVVAEEVAAHRRPGGAAGGGPLAGSEDRPQRGIGPCDTLGWVTLCFFFFSRSRRSAVQIPEACDGRTQGVAQRVQGV